MITKSWNEKIRGDTRILELLILKEKEAVRNIGDPASVIGVYNAEEEEFVVKDAIEQGMSTEEATRHFQAQKSGPTVTEDIDPVQALLGELDPIDDDVTRTRDLDSVFTTEYAFLKTALEHMQSDSARSDRLQVSFDDDEKRIQLTAPPSLKQRFEWLPKPARPRKDILDICADREAIKREIRRCRSDDDAWPAIHYLWPLHPVIDWATDKVTATFGEQEAPVLALPSVLDPADASFLISVLYSNRKGQTILQDLICIRTRHGKHVSTEPFAKTKEFNALRKENLANAGRPPITDHAQEILPAVLKWATEHGYRARADYEAAIEPKLQGHINDLNALRNRHSETLRNRYKDRDDQLATSAIAKGVRDLDLLFSSYQEWIEDTMELEEDPYLQVVAVLTGLEAS